MVSDELATQSSEPGGVFTKVSERPNQPSTPIDTAPREFAREWTELREKVNSIRESKDSKTRIQHTVLFDCLDLAIKYPGKVRIESKAVDQEEDMKEHVQSHFNNLFNNDKFAPRFSIPSEDAYDTLLKSAKIVYIDDSILRFMRIWHFKPKSDDLQTINVGEFPPQIGDWMSKVQILFDAFGGDIDLNPDEIRGLVETLYSSRKEVVEKAMENEIFLPIPPASSTQRNPSIFEKFRRDNTIRPEYIHRKVYSEIVETL